MNYQGYKIQSLGTFPMYKISPPGSGQVPKSLQGVFTTAVEAQRAIDRSFEKMKKRKLNNVKKESTSSR